MEENKGRGKAPSKTTLNMLFAKAAGRCQLEGCNKSVLFDEVTLKTYNKSNVAHIVAASPLGARGDAVRSYELSDKLSNLMLLCPDHHKLIDDHEDEYPEERLLQMKARHEQAIAEQCDLIYKEPSEMVFLQSPIKGHVPVKIDARQCADAVMPNKRVSSVGGRRIKVEIEGDYHSQAFWDSAVKMLERRYGLLVDAIWEEEANAHFSVFPIAPIPLIIKLGHMMGDKAGVDIFQFARAQNTWRWVTQEQTNRFAAEKQVIGEGSRIALVISLTADITAARITDVYDADILYFLRAEHFGVDCIQSPADLVAFWSTYQKVCDEIRNQYPGVREISVFPAMPVSAAFEVGRRYMPGVYPLLRIFDDDNGFFETITVGGE